MICITRTATALGLAAALLLTCSTPTLAQQRGGMGGGMGMGMAGPGLVGLPAVQKELKMTEEQVSKARTFMDEYQARTREKVMAATEGLEGRERMEKSQEVMRTASAEGMKEVEGMLKPEQMTRLKQVVFQVRGLDVLSDPEIAKELAITPEQKDRVANLTETMRAESRAAMQESGGDRQAAMAKQTKIRKDTMTQALALMTPAQTAKFKALSGEPFELPANAMGGGRGGRPGGGN